MNKLDLIKLRQKQVGIVDIIVSAFYIGLVIVLAFTMIYGLQNINVDANNDGETDAGEAIGGIFAAFVLAMMTALLIPVAVIFGIGAIIWVISGSLQLANFTGALKKPVPKGFTIFVAIIQIISFIICFFAMIISLTSIAGSKIALITTFDAIFFLCGGVTCLVSAIFKIKLVKAMKLQDDAEESNVPTADVQDAYEDVEETKE